MSSSESLSARYKPSGASQSGLMSTGDHNSAPVSSVRPTVSRSRNVQGKAHGTKQKALNNYTKAF